MAGTLNQNVRGLVESDEGLRDIFTRCRRFAMIIASAKPGHPSNEVMRYLMAHDYEVFPVNPGWAGREILGRPVFASLRDVPESVDVVDVFRHPDAVMPIKRDAVAIRAQVLWLQIGVWNADAAQLAQAAGLDVVAERCPKVEHARLFG